MNAKHTLAIAAIFLASVAQAQQVTAPPPAPAPADHAAHHPAAAATAASAVSSQSEGEVRKVDVELNKITLRHGPLANLDMPPMTMVFTVTEPRLLQGLKQGDKVRFTADKKDGSYIVTAIEAIK